MPWYVMREHALPFILVTVSFFHIMCQNNLSLVCTAVLSELDINLVIFKMQLLERIAPATEKLKSKGTDFSLWYKPENYPTDL